MDLLAQDLNTFRTLEELRQYRTALGQRLTQIDEEAAGLALSDELAAEFKGIEDRIGAVDARIEELEYRLATVSRLAGTAAVEPGADEPEATSWRRPGQPSRQVRRAEARRVPENIFDLGAYRSLAPQDAQHAQALRDGAMFAVERATYPHPNAEQDDVRADLEKLFETIDDPVALSRHILRTGSPDYTRGFAKTIGRGSLTQSERFAMELGDDTAGGYPVPFQLDPTLIRTSDGAINGLRPIARVERITGKEWLGVTATGVTVRRGLEGTVSVASEPVLGQPNLGTVKVDAFVPFTIELGLAWPSILAQMAPILQDAKDEEEASSFIYGDGVDEEPGGLSGTLPDSSRISIGASFSSADLYGISGSDANRLPPRWRARARWLGDIGIYNEIRAFAAAEDGSDLWTPSLADGTPDRLLMKPVAEQSTMPSNSSTDGDDILFFGDFNQFLIVDRIGMTVEVIQHLTQQATAGTGYGVPVGKRGIYAHWHNNARILVPGAFRALHKGAVGSGS